MIFQFRLESSSHTQHHDPFTPVMGAKLSNLFCRFANLPASDCILKVTLKFDEQVVSLSVTLILQSRTFNPKKKKEKKEGPDHLDFIVVCELPRNITRTIERCRYGVDKSTKSRKKK